MAHIVNCIAEGDSASAITKPSSPAPFPRSASACSNRPGEGMLPSSSRRNSGFITTGEKPFTWRMQQPPPPTKRYQLFPRDKQLPVLNSSKTLDLEKATNMAPQQQDEKTDKPTAATSLKNKISQHSIIRRRKVSVPELGPMTTVHEVPMDSPTIPGRPPLHERSISAPADDWTPEPQAIECFLDLDTTEHIQDPITNTIEEDSSTCVSRPAHATSPKRLAPLVIPQGAARPPQLLQKRAITHTRSGSVPNESSKATKLGESPNARTPYTPSTSLTDLSTPYSSSTHAASVMTLPTPISAPVGENHRFSPKPWEGRANTPTVHGRSMTPQPTGSQPLVTPSNHRRGASESGSIMDRGRPRKRSERREAGGKGKTSEPSMEKSAERKAFEELPNGFLPKDATTNMDSDEIASVHKHAFRQAERFEVLRAPDVEALSKELRRLDERTEYLRRTYTSLRAGRRNLHARICSSLRSPRVARFTCESMLKQEEALAELDASIDDWVNKLEMAENRRTRVRQKLLEHVAAAAILQTPDATTTASESLQQAMGLQSPGLCNLSTPPRSPTKSTTFSFARAENSSPSPQRVVAQVPSTIFEHPVVEEDAEASETQGNPATHATPRTDVESIRIYAGDDIATLLADVEKEITRISQTITDPVWDASTEMEAPDFKRRQLHRQRSHEMLNGLTNKAISTEKSRQDLIDAIPDSPPAPPPPIKDYPRSRSNTPTEGEPTLTQAVFKP